MKAKGSRKLQIRGLLTDPRNIRLMQVLAADPRVSISELARRIRLSPPATRERLQRLEEAGIIKGCRLELDAGALGFPITAFVRVRPMPGMLAKVAALAQKLTQVSECYRITGEDCFILKVHLDELANLDRILDQFLAYGQTTTSLVQSVTVAPRALPLPSSILGQTTLGAGTPEAKRGAK